MKLLIVIPAYNEAESIVQVIEPLRTQYSCFDFIIVNDGSRDNTAALCRKYGYPLLDLPVNLGLAGAVQAGMKYAYAHGYDAALQFDADGQHRPEFIQPMLDKLQEGCNIVIGSRFVTEEKLKTMRMLGSNLISLAIRLTTGQTVKDPTSGMRMYDRKTMRELATQINCSPEPDTIAYFIQRGAKVCEVQVRMDERTAGTSYLNWTRSIGYMLRMGISIVILQWFRKGTRFDREDDK